MFKYLPEFDFPYEREVEGVENATAVRKIVTAFGSDCFGVLGESSRFCHDSYTYVPTCKSVSFLGKLKILRN